MSNTNYALDICHTPGYGLGNQLYSICGMCSYAIEHKIKYLFLGRFLREIYSEKYCNISDIIDLNSTNLFLKKYDIVLIDGLKIDLKIIKRFKVNGFKLFSCFI